MKHEHDETPRESDVTAVDTAGSPTSQSSKTKKKKKPKKGKQPSKHDVDMDDAVLAQSAGSTRGQPAAAELDEIDAAIQEIAMKFGETLEGGSKKQSTKHESLKEEGTGTDKNILAVDRR